jgi:hypothetical protein
MLATAAAWAARSAAHSLRKAFIVSAWMACIAEHIRGSQYAAPTMPDATSASAIQDNGSDVSGGEGNSGTEHREFADRRGRNDGDGHDSSAEDTWNRDAAAAAGRGWRVGLREQK